MKGYVGSVKTEKIGEYPFQKWSVNYTVSVWRYNQRIVQEFEGICTKENNIPVQGDTVEVEFEDGQIVLLEEICL